MDSTQDATADAHNVQRMQQSLNALGYRADDGRELTTDGEFGPRTRSAALKFQNERMPDPPTDGMIGPRTMMALARYADYLNDLEDSRHPCHGMYERARSSIAQLPPPCPRDATERDAVAAALTASAHKKGLVEINHVVTSADGNRIYAVQGDLDSPSKQIAEIHLDEALKTKIDVSHHLIAASATLSKQPPGVGFTNAPPAMSI